MPPAQLKDTRKALQEDAQREDDFLSTITELRNQLKVTKEAADEELGTMRPLPLLQLSVDICFWPNRTQM